MSLQFLSTETFYSRFKCLKLLRIIFHNNFLNKSTFIFHVYFDTYITIDSLCNGASPRKRLGGKGVFFKIYVVFFSFFNENTETKVIFQNLGGKCNPQLVGTTFAMKWWIWRPPLQLEAFHKTLNTYPAIWNARGLWKQTPNSTSINEYFTEAIQRNHLKYIMLY